MPLPIILLVVAGVAALIGGGVALAWNWNDIVVSLSGKQVAILGERAVGKTHLASFLATGTIPEDYQQTVMPEKTSSNRQQLKDLDLKIKKSLDLPGAKESYSDWKSLCETADVVLYLLRADRILARDREVGRRVKADVRHIGEWLKERDGAMPLYIIGTHCDLDPNFGKIDAKNIGDYHDRFSKLPLVREIVALAGGSSRAKVVVGSMKDRKHTEALVYVLFSQIVQ